MRESIVIKNVNVVDPIGNSVSRKTLTIVDGRIQVEANLESAEVIDGTNLYAAPGFIDMHVHVFEDFTSLGIQGDKVGIMQGVHKVVDAGSTGIRDFPQFNKKIIAGNETDVYYFLNIAKKGLCDNLSELADPEDRMTVDELMNFKKENGDRLVGLKVRMSSSVVKESGIHPLIHARKLSDASGLPLMVHIGNSPPDLGDILNLLKAGDIVTHVFHGKEGGIPYYPKEYAEAVKRGVHFDVGHGNASFSYHTVNKVLGIQENDYTISTDIYKANYIKPVGSLMETMSKFFAFRLTLEQLVHKVTYLPGRILGIPTNGIEVGNIADITLFEKINEKKTFLDSEGCEFASEQYIKPYGTIKRGKVMWLNHV